jgi:hypothetical protein
MNALMLARSEDFGNHRLETAEGVPEFGSVEIFTRFG